MTPNDVKWWRQKKGMVQRWAFGCLEQSRRKGLNSKAIETCWKDLLLLLKATSISQGHLIIRQQLSPFQMVIYFLLNASFSMPYCLLQQTSFSERYFLLYLLHSIYCQHLYRHLSLTSSVYNSELVVNERQAFQHAFSYLAQYIVSLNCFYSVSVKPNLSKGQFN